VGFFLNVYDEDFVPSSGEIARHVFIHWLFWVNQLYFRTKLFSFVYTLC